MIKLNNKLSLLLLIIFSLEALGQSQTRKVLFLGNSYTSTNNLPLIISDLATSTGDVFIYDSNLIGGYTLQDHYNSTTSKNKILSNDWDYIVLQEQSQTPSFPVPAAFLGGFLNLENYIKTNKPCALISAFMTWGHQNGDFQNCPTNPNVCTYLGMQSLIQDRYMEFSSLFNSEVTPVGVVWKYIRENHPSINLYQSDGSHPSLAGSYLAACCFYTSMYRKNPMLITNNYGLDENTAAIIRNAAKTIIFDQMLNWYIGKYIPNSNFNFTIGNGYNEVVINSNTSAFYDSLSWDFGDGTTSTSLFPTHSYANDGSYTIKLTTTKCYLGHESLESIYERTVNFCSHTNYIFPNDLLICPEETATLWTQTADSYQWLDYLGNPLPGETNQSLTVGPGEYSVITTNNNCSEIAPTVYIDTYGLIGDTPCNLAIDENSKKDKIRLIPNPVEFIITIESQEIIKDIHVFDMRGNEVPVLRISYTKVDVSNLPYGLYVLKVIGENDHQKAIKFIKNNCKPK